MRMNLASTTGLMDGCRGIGNRSNIMNCTTKRHGAQRSLLFVLVYALQATLPWLPVFTNANAFTYYMPGILSGLLTAANIVFSILYLQTFVRAEAPESNRFSAWREWFRSPWRGSVWWQPRRIGPTFVLMVAMIVNACTDFFVYGGGPGMVGLFFLDLTKSCALLTVWSRSCGMELLGVIAHCAVFVGVVVNAAFNLFECSVESSAPIRVKCLAEVIFYFVVFHAIRGVTRLQPGMCVRLVSFPETRWVCDFIPDPSRPEIRCHSDNGYFQEVTQCAICSTPRGASAVGHPARQAPDPRCLNLQLVVGDIGTVVRVSKDRMFCDVAILDRNNYVEHTFPCGALHLQAPGMLPRMCITASIVFRYWEVRESESEPAAATVPARRRTIVERATELSQALPRCIAAEARSVARSVLDLRLRATNGLITPVAVGPRGPVLKPKSHLSSIVFTLLAGYFVAISITIILVCMFPNNQIEAAAEFSDGLGGSATPLICAIIELVTFAVLALRLYSLVDIECVPCWSLLTGRLGFAIIVMVTSDMALALRGSLQSDLPYATAGRLLLVFVDLLKFSTRAFSWCVIGEHATARGDSNNYIKRGEKLKLVLACFADFIVAFIAQFAWETCNAPSGFLRNDLIRSFAQMLFLCDCFVYVGELIHSAAPGPDDDDDPRLAPLVAATERPGVNMPGSSRMRTHLDTVHVPAAISPNVAHSVNGRMEPLQSAGHQIASRYHCTQQAIIIVSLFLFYVVEIASTIARFLTSSAPDDPIWSGFDIPGTPLESIGVALVALMTVIGMLVESCANGSTERNVLWNTALFASGSADMILVGGPLVLLFAANVVLLGTSEGTAADIRYHTCKIGIDVLGYIALILLWTHAKLSKALYVASFAHVFLICAHLIEGLYNDHEDCLAGKFEIVGIIAALAEEILLFEFLHLIAECFESKIHGSERDPSASESTDVIVETANEAHDVERRPYIRQRRQPLLGPAHHTAPGAAAVPAVLLVEAEELLSAPLLPQDQPGRPVPGPIAAAPESNEPRQRDWYSLMLIVYYIVALVSLFVRGLTGHEFYITYTTEGDPVEFGLYAAYFDMSINVLLTCGILWFERRRLIVSEHQEKAQALWIAVPLLALVALNGLYFGTRVAEHSHAYRSMGAEFVNTPFLVLHYATLILLWNVVDARHLLVDDIAMGAHVLMMTAVLVFGVFQHAAHCSPRPGHAQDGSGTIILGLAIGVAEEIVLFEILHLAMEKRALAVQMISKQASSHRQHHVVHAEHHV